jgi:hypothetical protein
LLPALWFSTQVPDGMPQKWKSGQNHMSDYATRELRIILAKLQQFLPCDICRTVSLTTLNAQIDLHALTFDLSSCIVMPRRLRY